MRRRRGRRHESCTSNKLRGPRILSQQASRRAARSVPPPGDAGLQLVAILASPSSMRRSNRACIACVLFPGDRRGYDIGCRSRALPSGHGHSFTSNPSRIVRQSSGRQLLLKPPKLALGVPTMYCRPPALRKSRLSCETIPRSNAQTRALLAVAGFHGVDDFLQRQPSRAGFRRTLHSPAAGRSWRHHQADAHLFAVGAMIVRE